MIGKMVADAAEYIRAMKYKGGGRLADENRFCKDCKAYDQKEKKCKEQNDFVARKNSCDKYERK
jgi:hypothetical protein